MIEALNFVSNDLDLPRGARLSNTRSHSATVDPEGCHLLVRLSGMSSLHAIWSFS